MDNLSRTENYEITSQARESLAGNWGTMVGAVCVLILINIAIQMIPGIGQIVAFIIGGAFSLGFANFYLNISRGEDSSFSQMFSGFNNFIPAFVANFLMTLFIFLWLILLIIPGIIAAYAYSMTFFILADEPSLSPLQAITKSKEMMKGYKWKLFCLSCRFIGWAILAMLTLGIGFIWLMPYMGMSFAEFYLDIKSNYLEAEDPKSLNC